MKTAQIMERKFMGDVIRQNHKDGFFCVNDMTIIANHYRKNQGLPLAKWVKYKDAKKTKEFFRSLMKSEGIADIVKSKRGKSGETWVHPLVFFDYAMWLSPDFKVEVYKWLYDNLVIYRDDSGESYKEMTSVLVETQGYSPSKCGVVFSQLASAIKRDVGVEEWNSCSSEQLKMRDKVHTSMIMALKMGVEPKVAYKTIVTEMGLR